MAPPTFSDFSLSMIYIEPTKKIDRLMTPPVLVQDVTGPPFRGQLKKTTFSAPERGLRGKTGKQGEQGKDGEAGPDGVSQDYSTLNFSTTFTTSAGVHWPITFYLISIGNFVSVTCAGATFTSAVPKSFLITNDGMPDPYQPAGSGFQVIVIKDNTSGVTSLGNFIIDNNSGEVRFFRQGGTNFEALHEYTIYPCAFDYTNSLF